MPVNNKKTLAEVSRVENGFVTVMVPAGDGNDDNFRPLSIPAGRFKRLPRPGDIISVDIDREDVITLNVGSRLFCEVEFSIFGNDNRSEIRSYSSDCRLSGLYDNPADDAAIRKIRVQFWKQCSQDKEKLENDNPGKSVFIARTSWWTDKNSDRKVFSEYVRHIGSTETTSDMADKVPGSF